MVDVITKYRVISDYEKRDGNELTLKCGDTVEVLKKGKYIWYGKINNIKGFFPSKIVSEIENKTSDYPGNVLSSTAIIDNKKEIVGHKDKIRASMNPEKFDKSFGKIDSEPPLEDKRRTRAKSTGRPPSQVFMKGNILQRSDSMDNLSTASEDDEPEKQHRKDVQDSSSKVSQLVSELKKTPSMKAVDQKNNHNNSNAEPTPVVPAWMKMLPRKKSLSASLLPPGDQKSDNPKSIAPWMQEVQRKREHKLSLRSDDESLEKLGQDFKASHQSTKQSILEINNTVTRKVIDEKQIKAKSSSLESREISPNEGNFQQTTKVVKSYSLHQNNTNTTDVQVMGHNEDSNTMNSVNGEKTEPKEKSEPIKTESKESKKEDKLPFCLSETMAVNLEQNIVADKLDLTNKKQSKEIPTPKVRSEPSKEVKTASGTIATSLTSTTISSSSGILKQDIGNTTQTKIVKLDKYETIGEFHKRVSDMLKDAKILNSNAKPSEITSQTERIEEMPEEIRITTTSSTITKPNESVSTTKESSETMKQIKMEATSCSLLRPNETTSDNQNVTALVKETKIVTFSSPAVPKEETTELTKSKENEYKLVGSKENSETKEDIKIKKDIEVKEKSLQQQKVLDDKISKTDFTSVHSLLKDIEDFSVKHELRLEELKKDIQKLEMSINQQHQEVKSFIQKAKEKLNALIKT